jgi:hypothetical protein
METLAPEGVSYRDMVDVKHCFLHSDEEELAAI